MKFRRVQWRGEAVSVPWGELLIFSESEYKGRGGCAWEAAAVWLSFKDRKHYVGKKEGGCIKLLDRKTQSV